MSFHYAHVDIEEIYRHRKRNISWKLASLRALFMFPSHTVSPHISLALIDQTILLQAYLQAEIDWQCLDYGMSRA